MTARHTVRVYLGEALAAYHFGPAHPFGPERYPAFVEAFEASGLAGRCERSAAVTATRESLERFHTPENVDLVATGSRTGRGYLDWGDTPAFPGVYEAAAGVVGSVLDGAEALLAGACAAVFVPIAGLHHARREEAAGFCVFNDCGVLIEHLLQVHSLTRVAYVDIDAHHGDGVYYAFEHDPRVCTVDLHQEGGSLYPGTGEAGEAGLGAARGHKLNIPLPAGADDAAFLAAWPRALAFVAAADPQFIILQCGADGLAGDPLTDLRYTAAVHRRVTADLAALAADQSGPGILAMGGGGYAPDQTAEAWCEVLRVLVQGAGGGGAQASRSKAPA
jgi:acetoin utilization protein AcuC